MSAVLLCLEPTKLTSQYRVGDDKHDGVKGDSRGDAQKLILQLISRRPFASE